MIATCTVCGDPVEADLADDDPNAATTWRASLDETPRPAHQICADVLGQPVAPALDLHTAAPQQPADTRDDE